MIAQINYLYFGYLLFFYKFFKYRTVLTITDGATVYNFLDEKNDQCND